MAELNRRQGLLMIAGAVGAGWPVVSIAKEDDVLTGTWTGTYTDIEGHLGKMSVEIETASDIVTGTFALTLATEDAQEVYSGGLRGRVGTTRLVLQLVLSETVVGEASLVLSEPLAHAEQSAHGVLSPVPELRLGGGVLILWRYRQ